MKYKIIADSSCDLTAQDFLAAETTLTIAPLTIRIDQKDYVDESGLDIPEMLEALHKSKEKSFSACPSPNQFLEQMVGADHYFVVTISSKLSGSYNAAMTAKQMHKLPDCITVLDSKLVSGASALIVQKLQSLIANNTPHEELLQTMDDYIANLHLLFVVNRFDNLIANGRVSKLKAIIASTLSIKILCEGEDGEIKLGRKVLGYHNVLKTLVETMPERSKDLQGKHCIVTHCQAPAVAQDLANTIRLKYGMEVQVLDMKGLCSYYALEGGIIVSFEK